MNHSMMDELEAAWHELDDDPAVRVIVNTGEGEDVPDRPRHRRAESRPRRTARAVAPHARRRARVHRVAPQGLEAGDRGGQRNRRGRWAPLRRRRRHRDRREQRHVPRPARVGRAGHRVRRRSGSSTRCRWSRSCAWRWSGATSACSAERAYELGMISQIVDPPESLREAAQELAETVAKNSPAAMRATKKALWGALEMGSARRVSRRRAADAVGVGPPRPGGRPARLLREA